MCAQEEAAAKVAQWLEVLVLEYVPYIIVASSLKFDVIVSLRRTFVNDAKTPKNMAVHTPFFVHSIQKTAKLIWNHKVSGLTVPIFL